VWFLHATHILARHALREMDPYVGLNELLVGLRVTQDLGRGRVDLMQHSMAGAYEMFLIEASNKILARSSMTKEQLDDLAANLDAAVATEPDFSEVLQGESLSTALHMGLGALKPADWQPPGGRNWLTSSNRPPRREQQHDGRDDAAQLITTGLSRATIHATACPSGATLASCYAKVVRSDSMPEWDATALDRHAARVAMFPDDDTRHDSQRQLLEQSSQQMQYMLGMYMQKRAHLVARLAALRLRVQVLRDGKCPSETQLREAPYSTLRAPADWARDGKFAKFAPVTIACP
jgi:hypothetical protein